MDAVSEKDRQGLRELRRQEIRRIDALRKAPEDLAHRDARTFSPAEEDRFRAALGIDRDARIAVELRQARWEADPAAVAARDADITAAMRKLAEKAELHRKENDNV